MMTKILIILLLVSFLENHQDSGLSGQVTIKWVNKIKGDYSFIKNWSYPEGIYKNSYGQLCCDGICPERVQKMQDINGKILKDSIKAYYILVDTTHQFHSIQCEAQTYEWAGCNFIKAMKTSEGSVKCYTIMNVGTHCSLHLIIHGNACIPTIELMSIAGGQFTYHISGGNITIERETFLSGFLKASFDFRFVDPNDQKSKMFWKGSILTKIE